MLVDESLSTKCFDKNVVDEMLFDKSVIRRKTQDSKTSAKKMSKYQNKRMECKSKQKMSSLNVCWKLSRQYLYLLDKNNIIRGVPRGARGARRPSCFEKSAGIYYGTPPLLLKFCLNNHENLDYNSQTPPLPSASRYAPEYYYSTKLQT